MILSINKRVPTKRNCRGIKDDSVNRPNLELIDV